jgi:hypothetical protein
MPAIPTDIDTALPEQVAPVLDTSVDGSGPPSGPRRLN